MSTRFGALAVLVLLPLCSLAQTPPVRWVVNAYGPEGVEAFVGSNGSVTDQRAMGVDAAGNVIVAGYVTTSGITDWKVVKFNGATGVIMWEKYFDSPVGGFDMPYGMTVDLAGNAIVTGYYWNGTDGDIKTIKYAAADGAIVWEKIVGGSPSGNDFGFAAVADASGNVAVTGLVTNGLDDDLKTVKYAAADGAVLWEKTFANGDFNSNHGFAIAMDAAGNVIVTGESQNGFNFDWKTIKYAAGDGAIVWEKDFRLGTPEAGDDVGYFIAIDAANNVFVTGSGHNGTNRDWHTIKYAAADGAILWEKTFAGAGDGDDYAYSIALDAAGNAIVTGFSNNGTDNDWKTIKYAAATGAVLWEKSFAGLNGSDVSTAVAIDAAGNAIVVGRTNNAPNRDMKAIKYATADGALIWQYTYNGSANDFDRIAAVAVVPGGIIFAGESTETGHPTGWRILKVGADPADTTPNAFAFTAQTNVPVSSVRTSNTITPAGYEVPLAITVTGGTYSIGCTSTFTAAEGTIAPGETVCVRHTSSASFATAVATTLTIGGVSGTFTSTTIAAPTTPSTRGDANGDHKADLFWREASPGTGLSWWTMNGAAATGSNFFVVGSEWQIADVGDLNGDGKADIIWRRTTDGAAFLWTLDGLAPVGFFDLGTLAPAVWTLVGSADLNGDGKSDLLWRNVDGTLYAWIMNAGTITAQGVIGNPGTPWAVVDMTDLNGDGKADITFRNANTGQVFMWFMNGLAVTSSGSPGGLDSATWTLLATADFSGDGKGDLLWRSSTGDTWVWLMNGASFVSGASIGNPGAGWSVKSVADLDGDGKADIVWRHTDGTTRFWKMNGSSFVSASTITNPGGSWQIVAP